MASLIQQVDLPAAQKAYTTIQESSSDTSSVPHDGLSCYRAIARLYTGDPRDARAVMNAVLDHYMRVLANKRHPLSKQYHEYESRRLGDGEKPLFTILACPDICTTARGLRELMTIIANALHLRLVLWEGPRLDQIIFEGGIIFTPEINIAVDKKDPTGLCNYSSMPEEEGGKLLVDYLLAAKRIVKSPLETRRSSKDKALGNLQIREIRWSWNPPSASDTGCKPQCWNEYEHPNMDPLSQDSKLESFCVFTVGIKTARDIRPAIQLILEALARAPGQRVPVSSESSSGSPERLRPYVGVDAEFVKRTIPPTFDWHQDAAIREAQANDSPEQMCSVLSVAVDKYLCVNFYLLDMLENPDDLTVREMTYLFRGFILNSNIIKIWFNYQLDIPVLDSMIAHLYQQSPRPRYRRRRDWYSEEEIEVFPTFKITDPRYQGIRPPDLYFNGDYGRPNNTDCAFHDASQSPQGIGCPCETGNLDIAHIVDFISSEINLPGTSDATKIVPQSWTVARRFGNYANYLKWLLSDQDRLFPLLDYLKDAPSRAPGGVQMFYDQLGPSMEMNSEKMGYCIGDVVGIALIMRFLTTTDDRKLLASRLLSARMGEIADCERRAQPPQNSAAPTSGGIPLIVDYPKLWIFESMAGKKRATTDASTPYWIGDTPPDDPEADPSVFRDGERCGSFRSTSYIEHEKRFAAQQNALARVAIPRAPRLAALHYEPLVHDHIRRYQARFFAHGYLFDACKFRLPSICTAKDSNSLKNSWRSFAAPVIRACVSHTADLADLIASNDAKAPSGFLADPGSETGLPEAMKRRPGESLFDYSSVERAYRGEHPRPAGSANLGSITDIGSTRHPELEDPPRPFAPGSRQFLAREQERHNWFASAVWLMRNLRLEFERERIKFEQEGEPFESYVEDIYDPDGRQYCQAMKLTPSWNRPIRWKDRTPIVLEETLFARRLKVAESKLQRILNSTHRDRIWDDLWRVIGPGPPISQLAAPPVPRRTRTVRHRSSSKPLHKAMSSLSKREWSPVSSSSSDEDELSPAFVPPLVSDREVAEGTKRRAPLTKRLQAARSAKKAIAPAQSDRITRKMAREHEEEAATTLQSVTSRKRKATSTVITEKKDLTSAATWKRVKV